MDWIMRYRAFFLGLIILAAPSLLFALEPLEAVQQNIEKSIRVLENPEFENDSRRQEQQRILWKIMQQTFDFNEFSRKVLASHWYKFSVRQRNEFVKVFSEFLGKFYLGKLQDRYGGQKVNFLRQQMISNSKALVDIEVTWKKLKVPLTLRMTNRSGQWKVYDLSALGINAVSNYRAQFKSILSKESATQIIGRLKDKIAELDEKS
jgi:phospholipid transport system substrate-binding protein